MFCKVDNAKFAKLPVLGILGIWPVSAAVRLTAQQHAESADRRDILLGITKGNLFACFARWTTRSSPSCRCLEFGHMARQCRSKIDRSGTCRTEGTYCWELRKGTSLHVLQGGQPEVRQPYCGERKVSAISDCS